MNESKLSQKASWPPKGQVDSEKTYNLAAMTWQPEEILTALREFDEAVPVKYKGLLLVPERSRGRS